jgi:GTP-binding protein
MAQQQMTLLPFLYPFLLRRPYSAKQLALKTATVLRRWQGSTSSTKHNEVVSAPEAAPSTSRLNPPPWDYSRFIFQDKCTVTVIAGSGGHGCVSFLREKYIEEGPANGGDGGSGGGIYIQAVDGLASLHKLARRRIIRAGRGKNGQGKSQGGKRGDDILIQVPVGTVVREVGRFDPVEEDERWLKSLMSEMGKQEALDIASSRRHRWVFPPGAQPSEFLQMALPRLPPPRRPSLSALEPEAPIHLDLSEPMGQPLLLAAGAVGGYGNPRFISRSIGRPRFATRGEGGMTLELEFELKLLADVGLVGFPNAGKSTLLRSLTNSRTRIGEWEFTTLSPYIGTVVVDNLKGRPLVPSKEKTPRTHFTIADIPGLVEDAHLDRGLGLGFLRHIERAGILAFVVDLGAGNAVQTISSLWNEIGKYDRLRKMDTPLEENLGYVTWSPFDNSGARLQDTNGESSLANGSGTGKIRYNRRQLPPLELPPISTKPWLVIATKADLPESKENFLAIRDYLADIEKGLLDHPSGNHLGWRKRISVIPVSAIKGEGVDVIPGLVMGVLEDGKTAD